MPTAWRTTAESRKPRRARGARREARGQRRGRGGVGGSGRGGPAIGGRPGRHALRRRQLAARRCRRGSGATPAASGRLAPRQRAAPSRLDELHAASAQRLAAGLGYVSRRRPACLTTAGMPLPNQGVRGARFHNVPYAVSSPPSQAGFRAGGVVFSVEVPSHRNQDLDASPSITVLAPCSGPTAHVIDTGPMAPSTCTFSCALRCDSSSVFSTTSATTFAQ